MIRGRFVLTAGLLLFAGAATSVMAQSDSTEIPRPTGEFGVGTVVWDWADPKRPDELTADPEDVREVMAQAWYPADTQAAAATHVYAPLDKDENTAGWSQPSVPFTSQVRKAPLIVICPGSRTARYYYTSVAEDLASHGYIALVLDSPHIGSTRYPDGRYFPPIFIPTPEMVIGPSYEPIDQFLELPGVLGAGDVMFALDQLKKVTDNDPAQRLTGKIDWRRLGAYGHSLGARTCGGAVMTDPRFAAFAMVEGAVSKEDRVRGLKTPFLIVLGPYLPVGPRKTIMDSLPSRRAEAYLLNWSQFRHNNLNDLGIIYPQSFPSVTDPVTLMEQGRFILRTFFDQYVRETGASTLSLSQPPRITVEYLPKPNGN